MRTLTFKIYDIRHAQNQNGDTIGNKYIVYRYTGTVYTTHIGNFFLDVLYSLIHKILFIIIDLIPENKNKLVETAFLGRDEALFIRISRLRKFP